MINNSPKKTKDFDSMSPDEKYFYASTWEQYKEKVALTVAVVFEQMFNIEAEEIDFEGSFTELTNHNQELATHFILDVHEMLHVKVDDAELTPYEVYDTLFDVVLILSAEMTDTELGYVSMFDELEMQFN